MGTRSALARSTVQWAGLIAGPVLALAAYLTLPESYSDGTGQVIALTHAARATAALAVWMAVWWMTEAIPVFATALLPLAFLPVAGASTIRGAAAPYGHELIFLFMGGFIIALGMQRWNLHKRFAYLTLRLVGTRTHMVVFGFMGITAFMSMWVSNTATTIMMLPIALSVIDLVLTRHTGQTIAETDELSGEAGHNFALCLLLGIAYAASIGGIGTLIGTPPNLFLASYIKDNLGAEISFARWLAVGLPLVVVFVPLAWLLLTRVLYPIRVARVGAEGSFVRDALAEMGPMTRGEWSVFVVFAVTAAAWIFRPLLTRVTIAGAHPLAGLTDPGIAMIAALSLFVIPLDWKERQFAMDWQTAVRLPWGILILFGGGLSLAAAIRVNGLSEFIGNQVSSFAGLPSLILVILVVAMTILLTELTSNTATTAALVPILAAVAPGLGLHPFALIVPAAIAASCAFMLPVATPPNAIVFGSGFVRIDQMVKAGFWLIIIGIALITLLTYTIALPVLTSIALTAR